MSILYVGKITPSDQAPNARSCEVNYDGRTIGRFTAIGDNPGRLEMSDNARTADIEGATQVAKAADAPSLQSHVNELFRVAEARDASLRKMRIKLRKQTLFTAPGRRKVQAIASPYCERIRAQIKNRYPEAVILNTLSEDEAFRHYAGASS